MELMVPNAQGTHAVAKDAPAAYGPTNPGGHATQVVLSADAYVPAAQGAQVDEPEEGATHPGAHALHVLASDAPVTADAVPGSHAMQPHDGCPE